MSIYLEIGGHLVTFLVGKRVDLTKLSFYIYALGIGLMIGQSLGYNPIKYF